MRDGHNCGKARGGMAFVAFMQQIDRMGQLFFGILIAKLNIVLRSKGVRNNVVHTEVYTFATDHYIFETHQPEWLRRKDLGYISNVLARIAETLQRVNAQRPVKKTWQKLSIIHEKMAL